MQCSNCKTEISMAFKHSFLKNECPACGHSLMAEETLKIIEDLKATILEEINVREEAADKLSMALITKYNISFGNNDYVASKMSESNVKVYKNAANKRISNRDPLISAEDINKEDLSDEERDKILEEALRSKFQDISISNGVMMEEEYDPDLIGPNIDVDESMISRLSGNNPSQSGGSSGNKSVFSEGEINPYAEQKRQESLQRQRQNISSGLAKIKRA